MNIYSELHDDLPEDETERCQYTERAYRILPQLERPDILDIGCGRGAPTLTLARLSGGRVTGLDNQRPVLDQLEEKAKDEGLSDRINVTHGSMFDLPFPEGSFDIVWAEGSIFVVGFERALRDWRGLLKPKGYLVVHEVVWLRPDPPQDIDRHWRKSFPGITTVENNLETILRCGYDVVAHFALPDNVWWDWYFGPLQERVARLQKKYSGDPEKLKVLDNEQGEIDMYKKCRSWFGSAFFIMQRK